MKVVLLQNVDKLGTMGDTVNVARGYGRNYLLARGLAVETRDIKAKQAISGVKEKRLARQKLKKVVIIKESKKEKRQKRQIEQNKKAKKIIISR